jgi:hypothetical protein
VKSVKRYFSLALIVLGLTSAAAAQPYSQTWEESNTAPLAKTSSEYTLGWQDTQTEASGVVNAPVVEAPVAVSLTALPGLIAASGGVVSIEPGIEVASASGFVSSSQTRSLRGPSSVSVPTHDITLHADRYFDHYADNYRYVSKVEVVTYRGDYPRTDVYENYAQYSTYDVYINDLKAGDRYEVRVTWDDGTYRIINRSVTRHPEYNVRVSTPG